MKPYNLLRSLFIVSVLFTSCKKIGNRAYTSADSMILHYHGGYSPNPSSGVFMITPETVKEDTSKPTQHQFTIDMGENIHNEVAHLLKEVPKGMLKKDDYRYSDGYVDGPGVIATAYIDGNEYTWYIEGFELEYGSGKEKNTKGYIEEFLKKVWNAARYLQEQ